MDGKVVLATKRSDVQIIVRLPITVHAMGLTASVCLAGREPTALFRRKYNAPRAALAMAYAKSAQPSVIVNLVSMDLHVVKVHRALFSRIKYAQVGVYASTVDASVPQVVKIHQIAVHQKSVHGTKQATYVLVQVYA
jgi:hypothetical protein